MNRTSGCAVEEAKTVLREVQDLSDLCNEWTTLRELALASVSEEKICDEPEKELIGWMIKLADRVCLTNDL